MVTASSACCETCRAMGCQVMTEHSPAALRQEESADNLAAAVALLRAVKRPAILVHRNPDGDCIGSALALAEGLQATGAAAVVISPDPLTGELLTIPGAEAVQVGDVRLEPDLWVTVDVSDPKLLEPLRAAGERFFPERPSLNIDHHLSNLRYAQVNYVDDTAASAAEIIHVLLQALHVPLDKRAATQLLFGIVNDTHSFQNSNTTAHTLRVTADLLERGAALDTVVYHLLLERTATSARLWAHVLPTLTFYEGGSVASLVVSSEALTAAGATVQDADGLVEFLRNIRGVSLAVLLKQIGESRFRLSLRSDDTVDSTVIAAVFGGGGHRRAAGCDADGSAATVLATIVQAFRSWRKDAGV